MPPGDRPRQPQLSAAAAKAIGRSPITPKIATKSHSVITPLGRRAAPPNQTTPSVAAASQQSAQKDETASPMTPFLGNNITPRSGMRQNRVDSANSTPSGTPNPERSSEGWEAGRSALGVSALSFDAGKQVPQVESPGDMKDSKFFFASDARSQPAAAAQRPTMPTSKPPTFFYANGSSVGENRPATASPPPNLSFTPVLSAAPEPASSKFVYANGTPDLDRSPLPNSTSGSTVSTASRMPTSRPGTSSSTTGLGLSMPLRPASPVKSASTPIAPTVRQAPASPGSLNRTQTTPPTLAPPSNSESLNGNGKRRVSIDASPRARGHARMGSIPGNDAYMAPKFAQSSTSIDSSSPPLSPGLSHPAMTMATILQAAEDLEDGDASNRELPSGMQSPTKSNPGDPINELVANARRERKVQDLEITNASLEAINRTLERQLRKQTAELRRYRRLSRSGRLSLASIPSSRMTSETFSEPPALSDLSEEDDADEEVEEEDSLDDSEFSSTDSGSAADTLSPNGKMLARRKRDERRLQLDLTKHQELLVDSQKMNQSIKRCMDWTEVLIKEGQKALDYHVRVSDVEFGGRVLAPPDEEDEDHDGSSSREEETSRYADEGEEDAGLEPPWGKAAPDRDSGIELRVDGGQDTEYSAGRL